MGRRVLWIALVLVLVLGVGFVAVPAGRNLVAKLVSSLSGDATAPPVPIETAELGGAGPGSLVSAMTMPAFTAAAGRRDLRAARVVYRSTNGDTGEETVVSGAVFAPNGQPPTGGWPIVSLAHGTTGIDKECAPSLEDSLGGLSEPVVGFVKNGYAVAVTDYQGLGEDGVHPYPDAKTAGLNVIDAVRALRHTFPGTSDRWLAFGGSQGGGAAWAADERAKTYAPELDLVGAVAGSPAADVAGLVDKMQAGTLTKDQRPAMIAVVESLARLHPDLNRDDFRRGSAAKTWVELLACKAPDPQVRTDAIDQLTAQEIQPATAQAADRIRQLLKRWALPQKPLSAPLSIVYGAKDSLIDPQWTTEAIARACALGGVIEWDLQPDKGHGDIDISRQLTWVADRFAGKPAANDCP